MKKELDLYKTTFEKGKSTVVTDIHQKIKRLLADKELSDKRKLKMIEKILSKDYKAYIEEYGEIKPTAYEKKFCYARTHEHRNIKVDIYIDDYGQQEYFYYKGKHVAGAYSTDVEDYIDYIIDNDLDTIIEMSSLNTKYKGAVLKYKDYKHTKVIFVYRNEELKMFDLSSTTSKVNLNSIQEFIQKCCKTLDELFNDAKFQEAERERVKSNNLYLHEIIESQRKE